MNKNISAKIEKILPFAGLISISIVTRQVQYNPEVIKPYLLVICGILLVNLWVATRGRFVTYFTIALTSMTFLGSLMILLNQPIGQLFLKFAITALYIALFLIVALPPLFGLDPFTYEHSKKDYPEALWGTQQFKVINLILNYIWAGIFALSIWLTLIHYSENATVDHLLQNLVPIAIIVAMFPFNKILPPYLMTKIKADPLQFNSVADMFAVMPFGLNRNRAAGLDVVMQFNLSGDENILGYLTFKDQACSFQEGQHPKPTLTFTAPSKVWLDITNGELAGKDAMNRMKKQFQVEGDAAILNGFVNLFTPDESSALEN